MRLVWAWLTLTAGMTAVACNAVNGLNDYAFDLGEAGGASGATTASSSSSDTSSSSSTTGSGGTGGSGGQPSCGPCQGTCETELRGFNENWLRLSTVAADTPTLTPDPDGAIVQLTAAAQQKQGTIFWPQPIVTPSFVARFEIRVSEPGMPRPGDGLAFVAQRASPQSPGLGLGGFGVTRLTDTQGVLFEVDLYDNGTTCDDVDPHIGFSGLDTVVVGGMNCDRTPRQIASQNMAGLVETDWYQVEVEVMPMAMGDLYYRISLQRDGNAPIELDGTEPASADLFDPAQPHYFGLGGATGGFFARQEIRNLVVTFPEAVCIE